MRRFTIVELTADRANAAAALSHKHEFPMLDSIIHANVTVWTQDEDFEGLALVQFFKKSG